MWSEKYTGRALGICPVYTHWQAWDIMGMCNPVDSVSSSSGADLWVNIHHSDKYQEELSREVEWLDGHRQQSNISCAYRLPDGNITSSFVDIHADSALLGFARDRRILVLPDRPVSQVRVGACRCEPRFKEGFSVLMWMI